MTFNHAANVVLASVFLATQVAATLAQETIQLSPQQDQMQAPSAHGIGSETGVLGPPGPRFKVALKDFEVFDETGWDFFGSDEAVFIVKTNTYGLKTREFGSLDSDGKVHAFDPDATCIIPAMDTGAPDLKWSCDANGKAAPINFFIEAWEQDFELFGFCAKNLALGDVYPNEFDFCADDLGRASLIGQERLDFDLPTLISKLPQVGQSFSSNVWLQGGCFRVNCGPGDISPRYNVNFIVTRLPDSAGMSGGVVVEQ